MRSIYLVAVVGLIAIGTESCAPGRDDLTDPPVLGDGSVTAAVLSATAAPGAVVDVRFVSTSTSDFGFSSCGRLVERRVGATWEQLPPELRMCIAVVDLVRAGATATYRVDVPPDATPGTYRFVFEMLKTGPDGGGMQINVASEPFRVE
jgi:hypothetical protein